MSFRHTTISKGYFPKELPPPFTTTPFARFATDKPTIKRRLLNQRILSKALNPQDWAALTVHNKARQASLVRRLSIPNPVHFYRLVDVLGKNFKRVFSASASGTIAGSRPVFRLHDERAIDAMLHYRDLTRRRISATSLCDVVLHADVSRCYPTIYTHSIPWALHGKSRAKASMRSATLLGNKIDKAIRDGQRGQTLGIPIGPDTSLLIAEIILARVDREMKKHLSKSYRWFDDYTIGFASESSARSGLAELERCLSNYELQLGSEKSRIQRLPGALDGGWKYQLLLFLSRIKRIDQEIVEQLFQVVQDLSKQYPKDSVATFAIQFLHSKTMTDRTWHELERTLAHFCLADASALPRVCGLISRRILDSKPVDKDFWCEFISGHVMRHAPSDHGNQVSWALWLALLLETKLGQKPCVEICKMTDNVVALLYLHLRSKGLTHLGSPVTRWQKLVSNTALVEENWLLVYEAIKKGWLSDTGGFVTGNSIFGPMISDDVYFYDENAGPWESLVHPNGPPFFVIEQYLKEANIVVTSDNSTIEESDDDDEFVYFLQEEASFSYDG